MITFSYLAIFLLLAILCTIFDMKIFDETFFEALRNLLFSEVATGRMIVIVTVMIGIASSAAVDFHLWKARKKNRSS
ncbi:MULTISPECIES: hypothetical protein [unclassified Cytobacillus]|uniref:hypothetical protein n=1 Tax=unclassified Cytobacillus TaxID=2675268 RepID=UPI001356D773|nr:hypothetical protein [Cytobacillus sp. AMY 15.2]KAF0820707.1 hypothetical protein KIS4809_0234 [Bacillus sp. ZZV12-4809]MCM3090571.1 hypothetical protein [Cytobacillus sp. AMY 15.2]